MAIFLCVSYPALNQRIFHFFLQCSTWIIIRSRTCPEMTIFYVFHILYPTLNQRIFYFFLQCSTWIVIRFRACPEMAIFYMYLIIYILPSINEYFLFSSSALPGSYPALGRLHPEFRRRHPHCPHRQVRHHALVTTTH